MKNLIRNLARTTSESLSMLKDNLKHITHEICTEEEIEEADQALYDAPTFTIYTEYYYNQYAIVGIYKGLLRLWPLGESEHTQKTYTVDDLDKGELLYLALSI